MLRASRNSDNSNPTSTPTPQPPRRSAGWGMGGRRCRRRAAAIERVGLCPQPRLSGVARLGVEPQPRMSARSPASRRRRSRASGSEARRRRRRRQRAGRRRRCGVTAGGAALLHRSCSAAGARGKSVRMSVGGALTKRMSAGQQVYGRRREQEGVGGSADAARSSPQHVAAADSGAAEIDLPSGCECTFRPRHHPIDARSRLRHRRGDGGGGGAPPPGSKLVVRRRRWRRRRRGFVQVVGESQGGGAADVGRRGAAAHDGGHRGASLERAARGEAAVEHGVSRDGQRARLRHAARHAIQEELAASCAPTERRRRRRL